MYILTQRQLSAKIKKLRSLPSNLVPYTLVDYMEQRIFDFFADTYPDTSVTDIHKMAQGAQGHVALALLERSEL